MTHPIQSNRWHPDPSVVAFAVMASVAMLGYTLLTMWVSVAWTPLVWIAFYWTGSIGGLIVVVLWGLIADEYLEHLRSKKLERRI